VGWLELGNHLEANEELDQITASLRAHPDVLLVRCEVYAKAKKWEMASEISRAITELVPDSPHGWIHLAFALHEMQRTKEAWNVLLPVVDQFPQESFMRYNLACYACQLGLLEEAKLWLEKAFEISDVKKMKLMALEDSDLKPMWKEIGKL